MTAAAQLFDALGAATSGIRTADTRIAGPALVDRARRYAAGLRALGVEPGDRVAALAHPSVDLVVANLGCYVAGAVHVPINTRYRGAEIAHILADSGAAPSPPTPRATRPWPRSTRPPACRASVSTAPTAIGALATPRRCRRRPTARRRC